VVNTSNTIVLGNSNTTSFQCRVPLSNLSDKRDKKDIVPLEIGMNFIEKIKPVRFTWNMRDGGKKDIPEIGFIAQDLQQAQLDSNLTIPNLVCNMNSDSLGITQSTLIPILVKSIQELKVTIDHLKSRLRKVEQNNL
jgi:hypothetical protein